MSKKLTPEAIEAGKEQARKRKLKVCPKCKAEACLFAGEGMWDWQAYCPNCGHTMTKNYLKSLLYQWNMWG